MNTIAHADVEQDLAAAEQAGLKLMLKARTVVLALMMAITISAANYPTNLIGAGVMALFLISGLVQHRMVGTKAERWWHRYAFFSVDILAIAALLTFMPLSLGSSEIPQIFVFRTFGVEYTFALVALAALSLTPGLVLWVGALITASLWATYFWIVSGMERTLSWDDLPVGPSREEFINLFLNPDFVGSQTRFVESFFILSCTAVIALVVHRARGVVRARATADRQRARALEVFGQYVPPQIAQRLLESETSLLPESRTASVLFADIEGFTRLSENKSPESVIALLNTYFDAVTDIVSDQGGVVISFVGDAVVAAFNAPLPVEEHARQAVRTARALLDTCATREFEGETIRIRIGIATGPVAAGCVGGGRRQAYTVYGDTVNLAQRLEALNKEHGTRAMFLQATADAAGSEFAFREVAATPVRGRSNPVNVFTFDEAA
ncbi:adenylate/guanylate cyclase domain-containing protein [Nitratireductor sp. XY-223]|uniref:adenylate/guanylate cyclase domain-containing protein n=1 Tax=Nitratireductor sp. XY-223 TaxID=2561926 RepID=UPI0010AA8F19|nr:adenylate/guanylate cyclase domain-containing protein [Nitratireductor sp. XY-223]